MSLSIKINSEVSEIIKTTWDKRLGVVVPSTENIKLAGGAVELDATFLYADLANSSKMAKNFDRRIVAKILKSFLATSARLIRARTGVVVSFDGDRVMGVFVGDTKNSNAVKCALNINYTVTEVIKKKFEQSYTIVKDATFEINHAVGIDTGTVLMVRAGARGANDLVSIGRAPNLAAKLSDLREKPYNTFITAPVYNKIIDSVKYSSSTGDNMWQQRSWNFLDQRITIYRSSWWFKP